MAIPITQYPSQIQGVASTGTTALMVGAVGYNTTINGITFNSSTSNNIIVSLSRLNPASTVIAYAFNLAAGDVVSDNNSYVLGPGDTLEITTTAAATNYMLSANSVAITAQRIVYQ